MERMRTRSSQVEDASYEAAHLGLVLFRAVSSIVRQGELKLQQSGLSSTDFRVLEVLLHKGPTAVNTIGPKVSLTAGAISVAIDRLETRNLVHRQEGERDRRVRTVSLTEEGKKIIVPAFKAHAAYLRDVFASLTPVERQALESMLKKIGKHAQSLSEF